MATLGPQPIQVQGHIDAGAPVQRSLESLQNTLRSQADADMNLAKTMIDLRFKNAAEERAVAQENRIKEQYEIANNTQEAAKSILATKNGDISSTDAASMFGPEALAAKTASGELKLGKDGTYDAASVAKITRMNEQNLYDPTKIEGALKEKLTMFADSGKKVDTVALLKLTNDVLKEKKTEIDDMKMTNTVTDLSGLSSKDMSKKLKNEGYKFDPKTAYSIIEGQKKNELEAARHAEDMGLKRAAINESRQTRLDANKAAAKKDDLEYGENLVSLTAELNASGKDTIAAFKKQFPGAIFKGGIYVDKNGVAIAGPKTIASFLKGNAAASKSDDAYTKGSRYAPTVGDGDETRIRKWNEFVDKVTMPASNAYFVSPTDYTNDFKDPTKRKALSEYVMKHKLSAEGLSKKIEEWSKSYGDTETAMKYLGNQAGVDLGKWTDM